MTALPFADRAQAGRMLAAEIVKRSPLRPVVYALPRGGVPVAREIAAALHAPLDLLLVRKIGVPWQPELAAGSIVDGERPDIIVNDDIIRAARVSAAEFNAVASAELKEIERRRDLYLPDRNPISAADRTAILVDDGVATGASMRAAIVAIQRRAPMRVIVAVPVAAPEAVRELSALVDDFVCLAAPESFRGVGACYRDFHQLDDGEVIALLATPPFDAADREPAALT